MSEKCQVGAAACLLPCLRLRHSSYRKLITVKGERLGGDCASAVIFIYTLFMMSTDDEKSSDFMMCCASCGKAEIDDIKLKDCDDCDLVKYCSDECQKIHREQHVEACKKRKAELRDKQLFTMPDGSHLGECPICYLPLPIDPSKSGFNTCCSKIICQGCAYANTKREIKAGLQQRCVFCREPLAKTDEEVNKRGVLMPTPNVSLK